MKTLRTALSPIKEFFCACPYKTGCAGLRPEEIVQIMNAPCSPENSSPFAKTLGKILST